MILSPPALFRFRVRTSPVLYRNVFGLHREIANFGSRFSKTQAFDRLGFRD